MEQGRALLAVVLIFALLFAYNYYTGRQARERAAELEAEQLAVEPVAAPGDVVSESDEAVAEQAEESVQAAAVPGPESDVGSVTTEPQEEPGAYLSETTTTVETPLWTAVLSNRGGSIRSWRLAGYADVTGAPVELVVDGAAGLDVDVLYGPTTIATGGWTFSSSARGRVVLSDGTETVRYEAVRGDGVRVVKEYVFQADSYMFEVAVQVDGLTEPAVQRAVWIGWPGIAPTEEKEDDRSLASAAIVDGGVVREHLGGLKKVDDKRHAGEIGWVTSQSKYFMVAAVPDEAFGAARVWGDAETRAVGFAAGTGIEGAVGSTRIRVFAGPQDYLAISKIGVGLEKAVDLGWRLTRPLSVVMLRAIVFARRFIPNYGVVIILFSVLTKLLFYRLTHKSFTEMKRMQEVQPKLEELKKKHGGDREALAKAQMELYKKEGVNPLGSCLPMLLQMPVFIALFQVLRTTIELRGAPFALWITDLSQPDTIAMIAGFPIHVLPLLMGVGMLVQQRFSSTDPSQAAIGKMMPIIFTALFYNFASGLVIYWLVNTVLSVGQQYYIHRGAGTPSTQPADAATGPEATSDPPSTVATIALAGDDQGAGGEARPPEKKRGKSGKRRRKKRR